MASVLGYIMIILPIVVILYAVISNIAIKRNDIEEQFFDFKSIGRSMTDRFETMFFNTVSTTSPNTVSPPSPDTVSTPSPVLFDENKEDVPGAINLTGPPEVCESTSAICKSTVEGKATEKAIDKATAASPKKPHCVLLRSDLEQPFGYEAAGTIAMSGAKISCSKQPSSICSATAFIKNGEVVKIQINDGGNGYEEAPDVYFKSKGSGNGCKAVAFIDDEGTVKVVEILDGGTGYKTPPEVMFKINESDSCQLWCKAN